MRKTIPLLVTFLVALVVAPVSAKDPYAMSDDTWITISGEVESVTADAFELDYGDGMITVEMDDGDRDADAYKLIKGDKVTVSGIIDDDFFQSTTIEAGNVYVEKLGTYFYASAVDEEDTWYDFTYPRLYPSVAPAPTVVHGVVSEVNDDEFVVDIGTRSLTVEVEDMPYDPLDDTGYQKVAAGDLVSVAGVIDYDFFEGRDLVAQSVTILAKGDDRKSSSEKSSR